MNLIYLTALAISLAGVVVLDARYRLFLWRHPLRAVITLLVGVALLLAVDVVAISFGLFRMGDSPYLSGITLAPHLPLEEPIFLLMLCQLTMVLHEGARRISEARTRGRMPRQGVRHG